MIPLRRKNKYTNLLLYGSVLLCVCVCCGNGECLKCSVAAEHEDNRSRCAVAHGTSLEGIAYAASCCDVSVESSWRNGEQTCSLERNAAITTRLRCESSFRKSDVGYILSSLSSSIIRHQHFH
jgi:hypothetical protein